MPASSRSVTTSRIAITQPSTRSQGTRTPVIITVSVTPTANGGLICPHHHSPPQGINSPTTPHPAPPPPLTPHGPVLPPPPPPPPTRGPRSPNRSPTSDTYRPAAGRPST